MVVRVTWHSVIILIFSNTSKIILCIWLSVLIDSRWSFLIKATYPWRVSIIACVLLNIFFSIRHVLIKISSTRNHWLSVLLKRCFVDTIISSTWYDRCSILLEWFLIESLIIHITWVRSHRLTEALQIIHIIWLKRLLSWNVIVVSVRSHRSAIILKALSQVSRKTSLSLQNWIEIIRVSQFFGRCWYQSFYFVVVFL